mmetsp:Transcript_46612/g.120692  ORF Transcript_46612/g.120692 Transcript_46612/m.120692 type:complete len:329 (-) Transcript_46612:191-1177(-)
MAPAPGRPRRPRWLLLALLPLGGATIVARQHGVQPLSALSASQVEAHMRAAAPEAKKAGGVLLSAAVLRRAGEQLGIAREAEVESELNAKALVANQQEIIGEMAKEKAEEAFETASTALPESRESFAEARVYAMKAQEHAEHIKKLVVEAQRIPEEAAAAAAKAIQDEVRRDAYAAAERASAGQTAVALSRPRKVAERVAEAAEPYHLALLRAQKESTEDNAKARSAATASVSLAEKARRMAASAQVLQAQGLGLQARQLMAMAHSTMNEAVTMKAWAEKLYDTAFKIGSSIGGYQFQLASAAASAAQRVGVPVVPELPSPPLLAPIA